MKILVDMNLSPAWIDFLNHSGHSALHWSSVGAPDAHDHIIMLWVRDNAYIVFTHDLDFSAILAASNADEPSVIQVRTDDPSPEHIGYMVIDVLSRYHEMLQAGALISVNEQSSRIRVLPLKS